MLTDEKKTLAIRFKAYNTKKMIENGELYMFDFSLTEEQKEAILKNFDGSDNKNRGQSGEQNLKEAGNTNVVIDKSTLEDEALEKLFQLNKSQSQS